MERRSQVKIAVVGTGNIGGTLGQKWAKAGHAVMFGARDANSPKVQALLAAAGGNASAGTLGQAIAFGEVVVLATPWSAVPSIVAEHAHALNGKLVVDATNNFGGPVINNVQTIAAGAPGAQVARAFNSAGWENLADPQFGSIQADLFYCAPEQARPVMEQLIGDIGLRPIWVGGLDQVQLVDAVGSLWVTLALRRGLGRRLALKLLS
jgi:predicted dinucleotide-binding enzyme